MQVIARRQSRAPTRAENLVNHVKSEILKLATICIKRLWLAITWCLRVRCLVALKKGLMSMTYRPVQSLMGHHSCWGLWPTCAPFVSPVEFHRHSQFVFRRIRFVRMSPLVRVIVVGAGNRGENYARYASIHPERMKVRCSSRYC